MEHYFLKRRKDLYTYLEKGFLKTIQEDFQSIFPNNRNLNFVFFLVLTGFVKSRLLIQTSL